MILFFTLVVGCLARRRLKRRNPSSPSRLTDLLPGRQLVDWGSFVSSFEWPRFSLSSDPTLKVSLFFFLGKVVGSVHFWGAGEGGESSSPEGGGGV